MALGPAHQLLELGGPELGAFTSLEKAHPVEVDPS